MADIQRSCESSRATPTTDPASSSASVTTNPNEPCDGKRTNWTGVFSKDRVRAGFTKRTTSLSQVNPKNDLETYLKLPSIPEEGDKSHGESGAIGQDGEKGQERNERKNIVVLVSDQNGCVATVHEELFEYLKNRFTCNNNEHLDSPPRLNQTDDSPSNDDNVKEFRKRRKLLVNRISSKKCRIKKIQRLADMEQHVKNLENHVETMRSQIKAHEHNQRHLKAENSLSRLKIAELEERSRLRALEVELKQVEVKRLRAQVECIQLQTPIIDNMVPMDYYCLNQQPVTATSVSTPEIANGSRTSLEESSIAHV